MVENGLEFSEELVTIESSRRLDAGNDHALAAVDEVKVTGIHLAKQVLAPEVTQHWSVMLKQGQIGND